MRHGLDFVDLENPEVCLPTVRLEKRIMIGAEMPRCVLTRDGGVEHAADVGAIDGTTMHADSDEATGELVHDHEHPVAPEHDGPGPQSFAVTTAKCSKVIRRFFIRESA